MTESLAAATGRGITPEAEEVEKVTRKVSKRGGWSDEVHFAGTTTAGTMNRSCLCGYAKAARLAVRRSPKLRSLSPVFVRASREFPSQCFAKNTDSCDKAVARVVSVYEKKIKITVLIPAASYRHDAAKHTRVDSVNFAAKSSPIRRRTIPYNSSIITNWQSRW